jgi:hypothetical protein
MAGFGRAKVIIATVVTRRAGSVRGYTSSRRSMLATSSRRSMLAFVSFAPALDPFGEGTEMRCILHAGVSYVVIGTLARRKKAVLSQLAIIIRIRHDTPHSPKYN